MNNKIYERLKKNDFSEAIKNENLNVIGYGIYDVNEKPHENANKRYYLEININGKNNNNTLVAILMNPADTYPNCGFDRTIQNVIKLAQKEEYKKLIILNSFPVIQSKGSKAQEEYIEDKENENFIELFFNNYNEPFDIFPACGDLVSKDLFETYITQIGNCKNKNKHEIWSFASLTKKGRPRHVSPKARYNMKLFKNFMENEIKKHPLEIKSGILKEIRI